MEIIKLPYSEVPLLAARDTSYINEVPALRPFYKYPVELASFPKVIADKQKEPTNRNVLVEVLRGQHEKFSPSPAVASNIEKLSQANTFTITTAHQPSLFTGPLYYLYKIISAINLAEKLNKTYPDFNFVPIFITSGEDHDFEEVNHLHLFNKDIRWDSGETGPVGNMKTDSLAFVLAELKDILGDGEHASAIYQLIESTHASHELYSDAAFALAHELFKEDGLVVLNTNDARLKQLFIPIIKEEIFDQPSAPLVSEVIAGLEKAGFPSQATPREINFFYIGKQFRERIVEDDGKFKVLNTDLVFTKKEMEAEIEAHPERFSPNVIMRPIYQELILPNLAYVGGGGELAYWLERGKQFGHFGLNFPILVRRNSAFWIDNSSSKKMDKLGLQLEDLWQDTDTLIKKYLQDNAGSDFSLEAESEFLKPVFNQIAEKTAAIDPTLVKTVWAEHAKLLKNLEQIETRLVRAEKQKHESALNQIRGLKDKLFPGGGLQERYDNFLAFYLKHGDAFFEVLKGSFDPLEKQFVVIKE
ncbi:MAG: bacillithiol biosynthesis cysteine-adding enzyme BshC [Saprospiraceae bacterium]|nr:bacillithiol biosynthesis cysteine-adding enzyme BshC [Saprospiraceae bacterium]